ncbi:hypothetical protein V7S43_014270 [Phytophthora oleae]|uniref:Crinkler effector protein N-terminal domain-containing protein n=1 Tax=Phytophthora oleae TaxID=2107226 RepID=A0ABD3F246_9STRA
MKLFCAIVGEAGGAFDVNIDADASVSALKRAIKEEKPNDLKDVDANKLQLFLAKNGVAWLPSNDIAVVSMRSGSIPRQIEDLLCEEINPADDIGDVFGSDPPKKVVHVLVVIPPQVPSQDDVLAPAVQIPALNSLDNWDQ